MKFGDFIRNRRLQLDIEAKEVAKIVGVSAQYMVDFEKNRSVPPNEEVLKKLAEVLQLSTEDKHTMFDLAAKYRDIVSRDISEYVLEEAMARTALRTAKEKNLGYEFWEKVNNLAKSEGE